MRLTIDPRLHRIVAVQPYLRVNTGDASRLPKELLDYPAGSGSLRA